MNTQNEILTTIAHYTGTEQYHRHFLGLLFTDGVQQLAEMAECYWLIDVIASHQTRKLDTACDGFQLWTITTGVDAKTCVVECRTDSNEPALVRQVIGFTTFPIAGKFTLYVEGPRGQAVLLLPSEH
jgi:hypothetical protein